MQLTVIIGLIFYSFEKIQLKCSSNKSTLYMLAFLVLNTGVFLTGETTEGTKCFCLIGTIGDTLRYCDWLNGTNPSVIDITCQTTTFYVEVA